MTTSWKIVPGWPAYEVNGRGDVRRRKQSSGAVAGRILKPWLRRGYLAVHLSCDGIAKYVSVHRIVHAAFNGPIPPRMTVNHIDGKKLNNHYRNLEIATIGENLWHAARMGLTLKGERNNACKLTDRRVREAKALYATRTVTFADLARRYGVSTVAIRLAVRGETWKHIG